MNFNVFGINHVSGRLEYREMIQRRMSGLGDIYRDWMPRFKLEEMIILSTCNRLEIYFSSECPFMSREGIENYLLSETPPSDREIRKSFYFLSGHEAVAHCFAVASGLDSQILGEPEIFGQMKHAYQTAAEAAGVDKNLRRLFEKTFQAAKEIRSTTEITKGALSVASVAVELAEKVFGSLASRTILILGAGKTAATVVKHLLKGGCGLIYLSGRTPARAEELAKIDKRIQPVPFSEWPLLLEKADMVLTATKSPDVLLHSYQMKEAMKRRRNKPVCLIDLSVPRNMHPLASCLENVYGFNIEDVRDIRLSNREFRMEALKKAWTLIHDKADAFMRYQGDLDRLSDVIPKMGRFLHKLIRGEAESLLMETPLSDEAREAFEKAVGCFERNLFRQVITRLKALAGKNLLDNIQLLFKGLLENEEAGQRLRSFPSEDLPVISALSNRLEQRLRAVNFEALLPSRACDDQNQPF